MGWAVSKRDGGGGSREEILKEYIDADGRQLARMGVEIFFFFFFLIERVIFAMYHE